jgi:hypothetical protein
MANLLLRAYLPTTTNLEKANRRIAKISDSAGN